MTAAPHPEGRKRDVPRAGSGSLAPQWVADPWDLATGSPQARLRLLGSTIDGLTEAEAGVRLRKFGPNEPVKQATVDPMRALALQFTHTLALLLWFGAGLAFAAGIPELGAAIIAIVIINGVFAFVQEYRAEQVIAGLMRHVTVQARVVRGGAICTVAAPDLVPGDVIHLDAGDIVPADCVMLKGENLALDLSMLTGETLPVERLDRAIAAPGEAFHIAEVTNMLPAGSGVVLGNAVAAVWATGPSSSVGAIASLAEARGRRSSLLERQVTDLSRLTAAIAVTAGAATLTLAASITETPFSDALTFSTGIIVALVPEGLLPILSVSLAIGATRMAGRGIAVRRLSAIEVVGSVTVICTDKTGTLTQNALAVQGCIEPGGSTAPSRETLLTAVLCNDALDEEGGVAGDPIDVALLAWAEQEGLSPADARFAFPRLDSQPFDAVRRYMSVTCSVDGVRQRFVKGAPEAVLALTGQDRMPPALGEAIAAATSRGERVLLTISGPDDGPLMPSGLVRFADPPRQGVPEAIASCKAAGIRVAMLTGDHPETARYIARSVGLDVREGRVLEGSDLDALTDRALRELLSHDAVLARVDPQQKLRVVNVLREAGEVVVVTGDGINDAPALRAADVGVAMGLRGAEVAKQASDIVIADDHFATIVAAIEEGRSIKANIRRFISYVFTSNVAEMTPFLVYIFLPVPLPLAVIQALAIDIGTDLLPALALGTERPSPKTMTVAPEPPATPLLTRAVGLRTFLFFGVIEAALGLAGFFVFHLEAGWRFESFTAFDAIARDAATVTFLSIVGGQIGCLFAQRDGGILQRFSLRTNGWILVGLVFEIAVALTLVYLPGLNRLFSMSTVEPQWLLALPIGAIAFSAIDQLRRVISGGSAEA